MDIPINVLFYWNMKGGEVLMKNIIGIIGITIGVVIGLYVGLYLMFIGGIIGIVSFTQGMMDGNTDGMLLAINIVKIIFAGFTGAVSFYAIALPSLKLMK